MGENTKSTSEYRKAQRFFKDFEMPLEDIGRFVFQTFAKPKKGWKLSMDRTNWKFGKTNINILTVGVYINGIAIPVVWKVLPQSNKNGNSNTKQRIAIIQDLLELIPASSIDILSMDREFVGMSWFKWLDEQGVGFVARIKKSHQVDGVKAELFFKQSMRKKAQRYKVFGQALFFAGKKVDKGRDPYLYVVSNRVQGKDALTEYRKRWSIELLFSHLKKRGFNLEDTHMTQAEKVERLFGVVTLSFLATYSWGLILQNSTQLNATEKRKSTFRLGLESLLQILDRGARSPDPRVSRSELADRYLLTCFLPLTSTKNVV